tara:strand:+ start:1191 stop:1466 length:276 start_codon:yes stop_codon:yes gene_type:complete
MNQRLNDELQIKISVKWAIQIIVFIVSLVSAYYTLKGTISDNTNEIVKIQESLIEFEELLDDRVARLERFKEQELEEMNKSLLDKVLGKKD